MVVNPGCKQIGDQEAFSLHPSSEPTGSKHGVIEISSDGELRMSVDMSISILQSSSHLMSGAINVRA